MAWALPAVDVRAIDFGIEWGLPSEGELGGMLTMTLRLVNHATTLRTLRLSFSENDAFLFCGMKLYHFQLPPGFSHTLTFNLVPIKSGAVQLPMPRLLCVTSNTELIDPSDLVGRKVSGLLDAIMSVLVPVVYGIAVCFLVLGKDHEIHPTEIIHRNQNLTGF